MYRIILVDRDAASVQRTWDAFPWALYEMEVTECFTQTAAALEAITRGRPDAVFIDTRLSDGSGFELIRALRKRKLPAEIVMTSLSQQFEHVREALRLGVYDYLTKPIKADAAKELLSRLSDKLKTAEAAEPAGLFENTFPAAVLGSLSLTPIHSGYQIARVFSDEATVSAMEQFLLNTNANYTSFVLRQHRYFLVNSDCDLFEPLSADPSISAITQHSIGLSSLQKEQDNISLISEANIASHMSFITKKGGLYRYHPPHYGQLLPLVKRSAQLLLEGNLVEFREAFEKLPDYALDSGLTVEDLCFFWNQLILSSKLGLPGHEDALELLCSSWRDLLLRFSSLEAFFSGLQGIFVDDCNSDTIQKDSTFKKMLHYLNEHYTKQIKLKDVAEYFHINKNYASLLFKKYTNMTYSEYVNSLRLNRAKELLVSTALSVAEVAERSGYGDYFYFCKLFKKTFGITPAQYRREPSITYK